MSGRDAAPDHHLAGGVVSAAAVPPALGQHVAQTFLDARRRQRLTGSQGERRNRGLALASRSAAAALRVFARRAGPPAAAAAADSFEYAACLVGDAGDMHQQLVAVPLHPEVHLSSFAAAGRSVILAAGAHFSLVRRAVNGFDRRPGSATPWGVQRWRASPSTDGKFNARTRADGSGVTRLGSPEPMESGCIRRCRGARRARVRVLDERQPSRHRADPTAAMATSCR